jgi:hypothetical protein
MVTLIKFQSSSVEMGEISRRTTRRTTSSALHQSDLYGRVARQKPVKHGGGSNMLWGCFSAAGTGRLESRER